jgi:hypothetical protein
MQSSNSASPRALLGVEARRERSQDGGKFRHVAFQQPHRGSVSVRASDAQKRDNDDIARTYLDDFEHIFCSRGALMKWTSDVALLEKDISLAVLTLELAYGRRLLS